MRHTPAISRRTILKGAAAGSALLASPALIGRAWAQSRKVQYISPFAYQLSFAPELNSFAGGHQARHGLDVEVEAGRGGAMAVQQVVAGRAMFSRASGLEIALSVSRGADLVGIATIVQASNFFVVSPEAKPIRTAKDMLGKTIGVVSVKGTTENLLDMMLIKNNIPVDKVPRQTVGNAPSAFALVQQGRVDAMIVSIPTVTLLREAGEKIVAWSTDVEAKTPGQVYFCQRSTVEKDADTVARFLRGIRDSAREMIAADTQAKREAIVKRLGEQFKIEGASNLKAGAQTIVDEEELWFAEGKENLLLNVPSRWKEMTDMMLAIGLIDKALDPTKLYTNALIQDAMKS